MDKAIQFLQAERLYYESALVDTTELQQKIGYFMSQSTNTTALHVFLNDSCFVRQRSDKTTSRKADRATPRQLRNRTPCSRMSSKNSPSCVSKRNSAFHFTTVFYAVVCVLLLLRCIFSFQTAARSGFSRKGESRRRLFNKSSLRTA